MSRIAHPSSFHSSTDDSSAAAARARSAPSRGSRRPSNYPKYLEQREGIFYFKRKIPAHLRAFLGGRAQVWESLRTRDYLAACRELRKAVAQFELMLDKARLDARESGVPVAGSTGVRDLMEEMIPAIVGHHKCSMLEQDDAWLRADPHLTEADLDEHKALTEEYLREYQKALVTRRSDYVAETADQLLRLQGLHAKSGSPAYTLLCERLLEAEVACLREQRARLDGVRQAMEPAPLPVRLQPTLSDYLVVWAESRQRPLKTVETTTRTVNLWRELMGDAPAAYIARPMAIEFRNKLEERGLSAETIRNRLGLLRAVVNAYHLEKGLDNGHNPFDKVPVRDKGQHVRERKARRPYHTSELHAIYASPVFTKRKLPRGQCVEAAYWFPLIGPFMGPRIEELAQARLDDVEVIQGTWTLRISNFDSETQRLKTDGSFRRIPIHRELVKLGFLRYLCEQKRKGHTRIFPSLKNNNKYKLWSNAITKWFGRFLDKSGVTSPDVDFHAFRYNLKQQLTICGVEDEARNALLAHFSVKDRGRNVYMLDARREYNFEALKRAMEKLSYDELDVSHLYVENPMEGVDPNLFLKA